ncbi:MAG: hypothetical protein D6756_14255, partial [Cyanobacteria bacterium J083]
LDDDVTVRIHVQISDYLPNNIIGGALPSFKAQQDYTQFNQKLFNDRQSGDDFTAYQNLDSSTYSVRFESGTYDNLSNLSLTNANAKALGLITAGKKSEVLDGYILMNSLNNYSNINWNYDFDRQKNNEPNSIDFLSTALHEIGHALGFVSGVDSAKVRDNNATTEENIERLIRNSPLDLYRQGTNTLNGNVSNLGVGADTFFSIDGTKTIAQVSTGTQDFISNSADGFQASHWKYNADNPLGIMTPALKFGQTIEISNLDLRALDVIGWDRSRSDIFVDYSQMLLEGKIILGQKLERNGDANLIDSYLNNGTSSLAADLLSENKTLEVISMILDSEIYTWGSWGSGGTCNTCWNQELIDFLAQASFFDQSLY